MSSSRMAPPGSQHPGMTVVIAAHPAGKQDGKMPPPGMMDKPAGDGKVSPDEAQVYRADQKCIECTNYDPTSGDCSKVSGSFDPGDGCLKYFSAIGSNEPEDNDADEPEEDEETGS